MMTRKTNVLMSMVMLMALIMAQGVLAQDDGAVPEDDATVIDDATAPAEDAAPEAEEEKSAPVAPAPKDDHLPRFRFGISPAGGPVVGTMRGGAAALDLRFGAQINKMFGVYAQPVALVGAGVAADDNSASASGFAVAGTSVMAEVVFLDMIYLGLGPGILTGGMAKASASSDGSGSAKASDGPFFEIAFRGGVVLGGNRGDKRTGVSLGIDMQSVFLGDGDVAVIPMFAIGYEMF